MEDPRDIIDSEELTEDSDDELADLEKKFKIERQKILQKKAEASEFGKKLYNTAKQVNKPVNYEERDHEFGSYDKLNETVEEKEKFSGEIIQQRYISEDRLLKLIQNYKILRISKLFAKVIAPRFEPPNYNNWCFVGTVISKSNPLVSSNGKKYMMMKVGNFSQSVDVLVIGDAFKNYWKLRVGEIIIMLNPQISKYGGKFNLKLTDNLSSLLEIGLSKTLGYCLFRNRNGEKCGKVINLQESHLCEYHQQQKYLSKLSRMEFSGVSSIGPRLSTQRNDERISTLNESTKNYQFNERELAYRKLHFINPETLQTKKVKKAKVKDEVINKKLHDQLMESQHQKKFIKTLGLIDKIDEKSYETTRLTAFKPSSLNKIGFDPTNISSKSSMGVKKLQELNDICLQRQESRKLKLSTEDKLMKRQKRDKQIENLHKYEKKVHQRYLQCSANEGSAYEHQSDSGDELEIEFTNETDKRMYNNVVKSRR